ncbi:MAG TPA: AAA family ATPase [Verrucomicrobiae bacterium]|nr:AAA family ATPase [Verrucomicrobiae bacterium]
MMSEDHRGEAAESRPTLYLLIGYPGAGKTTAARILSEATGAVHLWSDVERHRMFGQPTHSLEESTKLYDELNRRTEELLAADKSVVFDTNFNFREDRRKLHDIAARHDADTLVLWIQVPEEVARERALSTGLKRNGYHVRMSPEQFDSIVTKLEPPAENEKTIKLDGLNLDKSTVLKLVGQYHDANIPLS